jgi:hypothetical protein
MPLKETVNITKKKLLTDKKINNATINQACTLLTNILQQNYLQFNNRFYQLNKRVAMVSPISGLIAEIFLQHQENNILKNSLDSNNIRFYNRYVDDILIIQGIHKRMVRFIYIYKPHHSFVHALYMTAPRQIPQI